MLERYDTIERDLAPFRARNIRWVYTGAAHCVMICLGNLGHPGLMIGSHTIYLALGGWSRCHVSFGSSSAAMVWEAAQLANTSLFSVRAGRVRAAGAPNSAVAAAYLGVLQGLAPHLPDMDFVVNLYDEPRVMLGEGPAADRIATACRGLPEEAAAQLRAHGFFIAGRQALTGRALPVLSQSKVPGCFLDITVPSWTYADVAPVGADEAFGWRKRRSRLFFRGSSTGTTIRNPQTLWDPN